MPSIPLFPNPPGTTIPSYADNFSFTFSAVIFSASTKSVFTVTPFSIPACFKLSITDKYESSNLTYFPTIAIFTTLSEIFFIFSFNFSHSILFDSIFSNCKCLHTSYANPSFSSKSGTSYKQFAVLLAITLSFLTLQNKAIFSLKLFGISFSVRQTKISGFIPKD